MVSPFVHKISHKSEDINIIRLIRSENVGIRTFYSLVKMFGSATKALEKAQEMSLNGGRGKPIKIYSISEVEKELDMLNDIGAGVLTYLDESYPKLLTHISDAPPVISYLGNKEILNKKSCSIVGARNASLNGQNFASNIAKQLSHNDINVISGLARGIDTAAHKSALPNTIAIIAGGIDHIYPPENTKLFKEIAEKGAVIAELQVGSVPLAKHFPQRNRIISGMSMVTLVVEASLQSGSLITSRTALEQGREVCAVPGFPMDPRCKGTNKLLKEGAHLIESFEDLFEIVSATEISGQNSAMLEIQNKNFEAFDNVENVIDNKLRSDLFDLLSTMPITIDEIHNELKIPLPVIYTILLELELAGKIKRVLGSGIIGGFVKIFSYELEH